MVETRSTGCRGKKADDQPQEEMSGTPRLAREPSVTENTTTAQMTHGEATVAEPSKSAVSTSSKRAPTVKSKTSRRRELARARRNVQGTREIVVGDSAAQRCITARGPSAPERQTAVDSRDMRPELRVRSPPCPRKSHRHDRQRLHSVAGNHSDWLVFRTAYRQTAPYLEEIDNIVRLRKHIVGAAAEATKTLFINESSSQEIVDFLEQRYGAPDALVIAETNKLRALPKIGEEPHELYEFSAKVNGWWERKIRDAGNLAPPPQDVENKGTGRTVRTGRAAVVASSSNSTPAPARPAARFVEKRIWLLVARVY
ncbi:hypothetical protein EVAR_91984_1 [Eumeta japonica]|uniref:Uncharacterized protein n=1 Tax=Eumeta variegata TaxID=151549 RepID=A0A4C2AF19_EUMVA|nr:hypothetical protein EVAR_91984_1 [Eumeta japonica]